METILGILFLIFLFLVFVKNTNELLSLISFVFFVVFLIFFLVVPHGVIQEEVFVPEIIKKNEDRLLVWNEETGNVISYDIKTWNIPTNEIRILRTTRKSRGGVKTDYNSIVSCNNTNSTNNANQSN
jgi:hypothetical protein